MNDYFQEWWTKGGSELWAKTVDKNILSAIEMAFYAGMETEAKKRLPVINKLPDNLPVSAIPNTEDWPDQ